MTLSAIQHRQYTLWNIQEEEIIFFTLMNIITQCWLYDCERGTKGEILFYGSSNIPNATPTYCISKDRSLITERWRATKWEVGS